MLNEIRAKAATKAATKAGLSTARVVAVVSSNVTSRAVARRAPALSTVMVLTLMTVSSATSLPGSASAQAARAEASATNHQPAIQLTTKAATYAYTLPRFQEVADMMTVGVVHAPPTTQGTHTTSAKTSTSAKTTTTAPTSSSVATTPSGKGDTVGQPCHSTEYFVANISEWSVPPSCYGTIYTPNQSNYVSRSTFGYCNWWVEALNPSHPDILDGSEYKRSSVPIPGAVVWQAPGVQGASSDGHWAQVVAVAPGGYWVLVTEMNFAWRGGGFGRVDYRYVHVGSGITFIYP